MCGLLACCSAPSPPQCDVPPMCCSLSLPTPTPMLTCRHFVGVDEVQLVEEGQDLFAVDWSIWFRMFLATARQLLQPPSTIPTQKPAAKKTQPQMQTPSAAQSHLHRAQRVEHVRIVPRARAKPAAVLPARQHPLGHGFAVHLAQPPSTAMAVRPQYMPLIQKCSVATASMRSVACDGWVQLVGWGGSVGGAGCRGVRACGAWERVCWCEGNKGTAGRRLLRRGTPQVRRERDGTRCGSSAHAPTSQMREKLLMYSACLSTSSAARGPRSAGAAACAGDDELMLAASGRLGAGGDVDDRWWSVLSEGGASADEDRAVRSGSALFRAGAACLRMVGGLFDGRFYFLNTPTCIEAYIGFCKA